ncbi:hypothetical protein LTR28_010109 [Elasticomyces elasticus]|nr:hypothetical protein LTR28_010109 [Elasticomyces elasticus]
MALQATPLIVSPSIIVTMLSADARSATQLELYLSRTLGFSLLLTGTLCILLTGSVPLTSTASAPVTADDDDPKAPYAYPTLLLTTIYHSAVAFYLYIQYGYTGSVSFVLGSLGSTSLAAIGLWICLFGSSQGRISKRTGADKRTSGFPFTNAEAAKRNVGRKRI